MTSLKKALCRFLTVILVLMKMLPASAQFAYKSFSHVSFGKFGFDLYCKTGSFGYGQQFYPANFYNQSFYDVHVKGNYVATLVCGNEAVSHLDFTCKKYSSVIRVDVNAQYFPFAMPIEFGTDISGLVGIADEKLCSGTEVTVQGWPSEPKVKTRDRITGLSVRNLKLFAIQDDGSEVPITEEGVMISTPKGTPSNSLQGAITNRQDTAKHNSPRYQGTNTSPNAAAVTTYPTSQPQRAAENQQRQMYQSQANNYLNAASHSADAIQQSTNMNLAAINASAAGNTAQAAQIRQLQQQQAQANNAAAAESINELTGAVTGLIQRKQTNAEDRKQQVKEELRQFQEEENRDREIRHREQDANEKRWATNLIADSIQKSNVISVMLGDYANTRNMSFSSFESTISTVYCVGIVPSKWPEGENYDTGDEFYQFGHRYSLFKVISITRGIDGSWPQTRDVANKLLKYSFDGSNSYVPTLAGFFTHKADALRLANAIKGNSQAIKSNFNFWDSQDVEYLTAFERIDSMYKLINRRSSRLHRYNILLTWANEFLQTYSASDHPREFSLVTAMKAAVTDTLVTLRSKREIFLSQMERMDKFKREIAYPYLVQFVDAYNRAWDKLGTSCKQQLSNGKVMLDTLNMRVYYIGNESVKYYKNGFGFYNIWIEIDPATRKKYVCDYNDCKLDEKYSIQLSSDGNRCKMDDAEKILIRLKRLYESTDLKKIEGGEYDDVRIE